MTPRILFVALSCCAMSAGVVFSAGESESKPASPGQLAPNAHFVSPDGKAFWEASVDASQPSSPKIAFENAKAGDTVYFRGGSYEVGQGADWLSPVWGPSHSGTAEKPITFAAFPGETPVIDGHPTRQGSENYRICTFGLGNGQHETPQNHIVFDGFTFQGDGGKSMCGIVIVGREEGTNRPELRSVGCVVRNCTFNGGSNVIETTDNHEGIRIECTGGTLIQKCRLYNFKQVKDCPNISAIKMYHNDHVVIESCEIFNCSTGIFDKSDGRTSVFRYNYVHNCTDALLLSSYGWKDPQAPNGYFLSNHPDCQIYHNVLANNGNIADTTEDGSHSSGLTVYNNTLYAGQGGLVGMTLGNGTGKSVYNNIIFGRRRDDDLGLLRFSACDNEVAVPQTPMEIAACDHNQFGGIPGNLIIRVHARQQKEPFWSTHTSLSAWRTSHKLVTGENPGEGSLDSNPRFVNASGKFNKLEDFRLAPGSPCIKAGRNGANMGADIDRMQGISAHPTTKARRRRSRAHRLPSNWPGRSDVPRTGCSRP